MAIGELRISLSGSGSGIGGLGRLAAQARLTQNDLLRFSPLGNVTIVYVTDLHGQLMPLNFRGPSINIGVGAARGKVPHLTGADVRAAFKLPAKSAEAFALSYEDFAELARVYGRMGGVDRIEIGDQPWHTHEETSKYTTVMSDGRARRFTCIMDAKSVVTNPSPEAPLSTKGRNVLSGLAWSGRGKVTRVDVTLDGGRNWQEARIDGLVLDKSLTRFYVDFDWDGRELLIQSRAHDETGYVQLTKDELRKVRGVNNIYHNNGIQTWLVRPTGETENVDIS